MEDRGDLIDDASQQDGDGPDFDISRGDRNEEAPLVEEYSDSISYTREGKGENDEDRSENGEGEKEEASVTIADYWRVWSGNRHYRALWLASFVSTAGDWLALIALMSLIQDLWNMSLAVSLLMVFQCVSPVFVSPLTGVLVDSKDKRMLMVVADISRAIVVLLYGTVALTANADSPFRKILGVLSIYVLTTMESSFQCLFTPAKEALLPEYVAKEDILVANSLSNLTWAISNALATGFGGVIAAMWGRQTNFLIDSGSFLLSAFFVAQLYEPVYRMMPIASCHVAAQNESESNFIALPTTDEMGREKEGDIEMSMIGERFDSLGNESSIKEIEEIKESNDARGKNVWSAYVDGLIYLNEHRDFLWLAGLKGVMNISLGACDLMTARYARINFEIYVHGGSSEVGGVGENSDDVYSTGEGDKGQVVMGVVHAVGALFSLIGMLTANRFIRRNGRSMRVWMHLGFLLGEVGLVLYIRPGHSYAIFTAAYTFFCVGNTIFYVLVTTLLQMEVEAHMRGRVFAAGYALRSLLYAVGVFGCGLMVDLLVEEGGLNTVKALGITCCFFLTIHVIMHATYHFIYLQPWLAKHKLA